MKTLEQSYRSITENGIPDPWQKFGTLLSTDGALSTEIVKAIFKARSGISATTKRARELFQEKEENLREARALLSKTMTEYDRSGMQRELDEASRTMNIDDALRTLAPDLSLHPFPVVLKSLEFNWRYMKEYGVRAFYVELRKI